MFRGPTNARSSAEGEGRQLHVEQGALKEQTYSSQVVTKHMAYGFLTGLYCVGLPETMMHCFFGLEGFQ